MAGRAKRQSRVRKSIVSEGKDRKAEMVLVMTAQAKAIADGGTTAAYDAAYF